MQKFKNLYGKKKSSDLQYQTRKMYSIKTKSLSECKDIINQIEEVFSIIKKNKGNLGDWEKNQCPVLIYS